MQLSRPIECEESRYRKETSLNRLEQWRHWTNSREQSTTIEYVGDGDDEEDLCQCSHYRGKKQISSFANRIDPIVS